jgi:hypothetical protein
MNLLVAPLTGGLKFLPCKLEGFANAQAVKVDLSPLISLSMTNVEQTLATSIDG